MKVISKHEPSGYMHVCDDETSKCGIVNGVGKVVVPLEMDYEDDIWNTWVDGGFIVLNKDGKVGFLFASEFVDDIYIAPIYDEWCYYNGGLSTKRGDLFYNLNPSTNIDLLEVPYNYTAFYQKYKTELINKTELYFKEQRDAIDSLSYDNVSLNESINGYMLVMEGGKYNYRNSEGQYVSDVWFEKATNFDQYIQAKVIYRGQEFYIMYDDIEESLCVTQMGNIDNEMNLVDGSYEYLTGIDKCIVED